MPAPPSNPSAPGKKRRRWLLYAAGLGILLALIVLLRKRSAAGAGEGEPGVINAPANLGEPGAAGGGGSGNAGEQIGSELNGFRAELAGANAAQSAGFAGVESKVDAQAAGTDARIAQLEGKLDTYYGQESPLSRRQAEEAAYSRGVAKVHEQDKAKAAAAAAHKSSTPAHKQAGKPAAKHPGHPAPKPHKTNAAHRKVSTHHTSSRRTAVHAGNAAPKPHKPTKKRR